MIWRCFVQVVKLHSTADTHTTKVELSDRASTMQISGRRKFACISATARRMCIYDLEDFFSWLLHPLPSHYCRRVIVYASMRIAFVADLHQMVQQNLGQMQSRLCLIAVLTRPVACASTFNNRMGCYMTMTLALIISSQASWQKHTVVDCKPYSSEHNFGRHVVQIPTLWDELCWCPSGVH